MPTSRVLQTTLGATVLLLVGGCVMPDQVAQMQKELADVRQELRRSQEEQQRALREWEQAARQADQAEQPVDRAELAELVVRVDRTERETRIASERLGDLDRRIDGLARELEQSRQSLRSGPATYVPPVAAESGTHDEFGTTPPTMTGSEPGAVPEPESLYNTAYADFSKGNYALAVSGFEEYVERFPETGLADNAMYWIGECYFSQGNFPQAITAFDAMLSRYPRSDKAAAANLKKALSYLEQNQIGKAIIQLRFVISEHPGSDEAKVARDKLTSLGAPI